MNDFKETITDKIRETLGQTTDFEVDLVPLSSLASSSDRMVRLRTIEEVLQEFESDGSGTGYLLQIKPKRVASPPSPGPVPAYTGAEGDAAVAAGDAIYLPDGKLNIGFLGKNAELLFAAGDYPLARNIYKAILQSGERTASSLHGIGRCYEAEGKLEEARLHYEESIAYHPNLEVYQSLAALLIRQHKDHPAAEVLERALTARDIPLATRFELHKACGNCWTRINNSIQAEKHYLRALEINPSADDVRANLGALFLHAGKVADAKRHFQDAIASNPKNDKAHTGLGTCFLHEGNKRAAHDSFAKALDSNLNNANAIYYVVKCAYEIKSYATAARLLEEYIQIAPVNANLLYSLAGLQFHLGRIADARNTAQRILTLVPDHTGSKELLAMVERFAAK